MRSERSALFLLYILLLDVLVITVVFVAVLSLRARLPQLWPWDLFPGAESTLKSFPPHTHLHLLAPILPLWLVAMHFAGVYKHPRSASFPQLFARVTAASGFAFLVLVGLIWSFQQHQFSRTLLVGFLLTSWPALLATHRFIAWRLRRLRTPARDLQKVLVIGRVEDARPLAAHLAQNPELAARLEGVVTAEADPEAFSQPEPTHDDPAVEAGIDDPPVIGSLEDLPRLLEQRDIHQVFMLGGRWDTATLRHVAAVCGELGVRFAFNVSFLGLRLGRAEIQEYGDWTTLTFSRTPTNEAALLLKRVFDLVGSSIALVVFSPIMLAAAIAIKLQDGGPVLFAQERSGLYGRPFQVLKFRTMVVDAEKRRAALEAENEMDGPVFKMKRDPRITRLGAFLRKSSIDEFPQFWNVFRGDMSLVGPRPPIPAEVAQYERWQMRRLSMKPGITCIWQVSGRNEIDFETWMKLDLQYIDAWSPWLDLKLILMTVPVVLLQRGAR
jgi:exopolysaccharide biosynthesis polyprenyl glycosylphosphotransferase